MDRPHGLRALLNELFGVLRPPAPPPAASTADIPELNVTVGSDTAKAPFEEACIQISPDAVVLETINAAEGPFAGQGDYCVRGIVNGEIRTEGNVLVTGLVKGNITAANISFQGGEICGDLIAKEVVALDKDSLVVGTITTDVLDIAGQLKGSIHAKSRVAIRKTALITGDIEAQSVYIEPGAAIEGKANTAQRGT